MKHTVKIIASICLVFPWLSFAQCNTAMPESTPSSDFTYLTGGMVTHNPTGLTWSRCLYGQTLHDNGTANIFTDDTCTNTPFSRNWRQALDIAESSEFGGHTDWRVPNLKELKSIVEYQCSSPALNTEVFPDGSSSVVWTSSPVVNYSTASYAWFVDFDGGFDSWNYRNYSKRVRLVRSGQ
ncbi:MAG: DUF1566 domain-containing protein [Cocleimonas sp.]